MPTALGRRRRRRARRARRVQLARPARPRRARPRQHASARGARGGRAGHGGGTARHSRGTREARSRTLSHRTPSSSSRSCSSSSPSCRCCDRRAPHDRVRREGWQGGPLCPRTARKRLAGEEEQGERERPRAAPRTRADGRPRCRWQSARRWHQRETRSGQGHDVHNVCTRARIQERGLGSLSHDGKPGRAHEASISGTMARVSQDRAGRHARCGATRREKGGGGRRAHPCREGWRRPT